MNAECILGPRFELFPKLLWIGFCDSVAAELIAELKPVCILQKTGLELKFLFKHKHVYTSEE